MSNIINLSEASSIAIHSMVLIAKSEKLLNVIKISELTSTSKHHVAKILQRLVKEDFLVSQRGPAGGFALKADPQKLSFLQIYESIEGKITIPECHMNKPVCPFDKCIMNNVVKDMTIRFKDYLEGQFLIDYI